MSDFTPKNFSGLTEAYASIYRKDETVNEEHLDQEIQIENLECDPETLVDIVVEHLVVNGFVKTENQALDMIPHIGDTWLDGIVGNFVLEQSFVDGVNSLLEEGCDLSAYTVDELYENYISNLVSENGLQDLHEVVPLLAAPLLANPATWAAGAALGAGALYAGKKALDAYRQRKPGTDAASERWLKTGSYEAKPTVYKAKVTGDVDTQSTTTRQQRAAQRLKDRQAAASSSSGSGGSPTPPSGGKGPKWKDILLGKTTAGKVARGVGTAAAADVAGTAYDPSKYSVTSGGLGLASGALSLPFQGVAGVERFGKGVEKGAPLFGRGAYEQGQRTGIGQFARGTGETLGNISQTMITQPWRKPATAPATPSGSGSQGSSPIIKNGQIVGWK